MIQIFRRIICNSMRAELLVGSHLGIQKLITLVEVISSLLVFLNYRYHTVDYRRYGGATYSPILRSDGYTKSKCGMYLRNTLVSNIFNETGFMHSINSMFIC